MTYTIKCEGLDMYDEIVKTVEYKADTAWYDVKILANMGMGSCLALDKAFEKEELYFVFSIYDADGKDVTTIMADLAED